ncbi:Vacuolar protein-sorting-associated protein 33-like protein [Diplonema papillatum]|nr:Vacuolar protein-sorting-associated protein 33-like protein [Diplonema papillatum]
MSVNLSLIKEHNSATLLQVFNRKCVLCYDPALEALFQLVLGTSDLRSALPQDNVIEVHKSNDRLFACDKSATAIFILQSRIEVLKQVANHINHLSTSGVARIRVYVVPRNTLMTEHLFTVEGVRSKIDGAIRDLDIDLGVLDDDVLTMMQPRALKELLIDKDPSVLYAVAKSMIKLEVFFGPITSIRRKGAHSAVVAKTLEQMRTEAADLLTGQTSIIDSLFLFDRTCDFVTPLLMQATYHGALDELYGMQNNILKPPFTIDEADSDQSITLDSTDAIFKKIRDVALTAVMAKLNQSAHKLKEKEEQRASLKTLTEIKEYSRQLPAMQEEKKRLSKHIVVYTEVRKVLTENLDYRKACDLQTDLLSGNIEKETAHLLEEMIWKEMPLNDVLKTICLYSLCTGGLKADEQKQWKRELVQMYGISVIAKWERLEAMRLLLKAGEVKRINVFTTIRKQLKLYENSPLSGSMHTTYRGFCPVIPAIIGATLDGLDIQRQWVNLKPSLSLLPGPTYPEEDADSDVAEKGKTRVILVFFIGGVTMSEIGALRLLQRQMEQETEEQPPVKFIFATTSMITGTSLLESFCD